MIKYEHCLCHLATGDMLRAAVAAKTPLGMEARTPRGRAHAPCHAMLLPYRCCYRQRNGHIRTPIHATGAVVAFNFCCNTTPSPAGLCVPPCTHCLNTGEEGDGCRSTGI